MQLETIQPVYDKVLGKKPVAFKFDTKEYPVQFMQFDGEMMQFKTGLRDKPNYRTLVFHHAHRVYEIKCKLLISQNFIETVQPLELKVADSPRRFERVVPDQPLLVRSFTTLAELGETVKLNHRAIQSLREAVENQLGTRFEHAVVYIYNGGIINRRLEALLETPRVIYYNKERNEQKSQEYFSIHTYENKIQGKDRDLPADVTSEVTVPIVYRGHLVFGYVQVNSRSYLDEEVVRAIKKLAINLEYKVRKLPSDWEVDLRGNILDISPDGISFEFSNRDYSRHFNAGKEVFLNLTLGQKQAAQALARVRHQDFISGKNWVGVSFEHLDPISEVTLEEVVNNIRSRH